MTPTTAGGWIAVANERAADAEAMKTQRATSVGPVYMAGYAIECSLKALLQRQGKSFPSYGQEGHNLRGLWEASGFRLSDLHDLNGTKAFFIRQWSTDLRYESSLVGSLQVAELVDGARDLTGWIQARVRRSRRHQ